MSRTPAKGITEPRFGDGKQRIPRSARLRLVSGNGAIQRIDEPAEPPLKVVVFYGDAVDALTYVPPQFAQACISDPPYGLSDPTKHDNQEMMRAWRMGEDYKGTRGYKGQTWDGAVPGPDLWRAVARCLVPGAAVAAFSGNRTFTRTGIALVKADLQDHDLISWMYTNAQPLNANDVSRRVHDPAKKEALEGHAPQLQTGHEPILIFRKSRQGPLNDTILEYGVGGARVWDIADAPPGGKAKNTWVLHENSCTESECEPGCVASDISTRSAATPLYPSKFLPDGNVIVKKPTENERVAVDGNKHTTQKPLAVMDALIRAYTLPGHWVIDPFLGSGTTAEAALLAGRNVIGVELREEECRGQILHRVERARKALAVSGQTVELKEYRISGPAMERFSIRDEEDSVGRFLREQFVKDDSSHVQSLVLGHAFRAWAERDGEDNLSANALAAELRAHGLDNRPTGEARRKAWHGLRSRSAADDNAITDLDDGQPVETAF